MIIRGIEFTLTDAKVIAVTKVSIVTARGDIIRQWDRFSKIHGILLSFCAVKLGENKIQDILLSFCAVELGENKIQDILLSFCAIELGENKIQDILLSFGTVELGEIILIYQGVHCCTKFEISI